MLLQAFGTRSTALGRRPWSSGRAMALGPLSLRGRHDSCIYQRYACTGRGYAAMLPLDRPLPSGPVPGLFPHIDGATHRCDHICPQLTSSTEIELADVCRRFVHRYLRWHAILNSCVSVMPADHLQAHCRHVAASWQSPDCSRHMDHHLLNTASTTLGLRYGVCQTLSRLCYRSVEETVLPHS